MDTSAGEGLTLCWHEPDEGNGGAHREALAAVLRPNGVALTDGDAASSDAPSLLLLTNYGERNLGAVTRLSRGGQRRLVVALAGGPENPTLDWQLLALGASEVLPWQQLLAQA